MTIAIGLCASNGIVVAADTQLIYMPYAKANRGKIWAGSRVLRKGGGAGCLLTGSGDISYLDGVRAIVFDLFMKTEELRFDAVKPAFELAVEDYYRAKILPFDIGSRPDFQLLVAYSVKGREGILFSDRTALSSSSTYAAVGIGQAYASKLLSRLYTLPLLDVPQTVLLAAYVVGQVKEFVEGCGGATDIYCLRNDGFWPLARPVTAALDAAMGDYMSLVEPDMLRSVIGGTARGSRAATTRAKRKLRRLIARLEADEKKQ